MVRVLIVDDQTVVRGLYVTYLVIRERNLRDYPLVMAIAVFTSLAVLLINLLTDVAYAVIDPRIRYGH